jgi:predicted transcriptional regulator
MVEMRSSYVSQTETQSRLIAFIDSKLNSLAKWDLIRFFDRYPDKIISAPKVASMIGRDLVRVEKELKEMMNSGLIERVAQSGVRVYRLSQNPETRSLVQQFLHACDDKRFREAAIYHTVTNHHASSK